MPIELTVNSDLDSNTTADVTVFQDTGGDNQFENQQTITTSGGIETFGLDQLQDDPGLDFSYQTETEIDSTSPTSGGEINSLELERVGSTAPSFTATSPVGTIDVLLLPGTQVTDPIGTPSVGDHISIVNSTDAIGEVDALTSIQPIFASVFSANVSAGNIQQEQLFTYSPEAAELLGAQFIRKFTQSAQQITIEDDELVPTTNFDGDIQSNFIRSRSNVIKPQREAGVTSGDVNLLVPGIARRDRSVTNVQFEEGSVVRVPEFFEIAVATAVTVGGSRTPEPELSGGISTAQTVGGSIIQQPITSGAVQSNTDSRVLVRDNSPRLQIPVGGFFGDFKAGDRISVIEQAELLLTISTPRRIAVSTAAAQIGDIAFGAKPVVNRREAKRQIGDADSGTEIKQIPRKLRLQAADVIEAFIGVNPRELSEQKADILDANAIRPKFELSLTEGTQESGPVFRSQFTQGALSSTEIGGVITQQQTLAQSGITATTQQGQNPTGFITTFNSGLLSATTQGGILTRDNAFEKAALAANLTDGDIEQVTIYLGSILEADVFALARVIPIAGGGKILNTNIEGIITTKDLSGSRNTL